MGHKRQQKTRELIWEHSQSLFAVLPLRLLQALFVVILIFVTRPVSFVLAASESNIIQTKHNLSATSGNNVRATTENQICVFCHTPHGATQEPAAPLWNRQLNNTSTYQMYTSSSLQAITANAPGGVSKLCLSCHDGTLAIGSVNVINGETNASIAMQGVQGGGSMPVGSGLQTGFTRNLGVDLTNDHPISFTFDSSLASSDGELRNPAAVSHIGQRGNGVYPQLPLDHEGKMQCNSCHDPHLYDPTDPNRKFLRGNRLQKAPPSGGNYDADNDMICLGCHDKEGTTWSSSVHASNQSADYTYKDAAATQREFPLGTKVWQAGCLNCHDTHTVQGSKRLLREGTDSIAKPKSGGNPALEETCYQCHRSMDADNVLVETGVPDIRSDFVNKTITMPLTRADQQADHPHDIEDADFTETPNKLGHNNSPNRHVACTDCHNPHRVMKAKTFNSPVIESQGTHNHDDGSNTHNNIASGALKGSIGVEPIYANADFTVDAVLADSQISFNVKKGAPPLGGGNSVSQPYVTREYQVCLRCHSNYGFGTNPPSLGDSGGGTPFGTNGVTQITNQAMEFQGPQADKGEPGGNHRSWHPVIEPTGRTASIRHGATVANAWYAPWSRGVGTQTMYCTDCHGNDSTGAGTGGEPDAGNVWGPHGSNNNFILKGKWSNPENNFGTDAICFKCHTTGYRTTGGPPNSGFFNSDRGELHGYHSDKVRNASPRGQMRCTMCHVALPHGWKNKAFLVNLNDVGPEGGQSEGTNVSGNQYTNGPYYRGAYLRIRNWATSGSWVETDCGKSGSNNGKDWMIDTCD